MSTIGYHQMLSAMREFGDQPFRISFVRATGKNKGSIKNAVCYYGAPNPRDRSAPTTAQRTRPKHVEIGTIPLTEFEGKRYYTPLITHILYFEGKKVVK